MGAIAINLDTSRLDLHTAHLEMVGAVLEGSGVQGLADALASLLGAPVAVLVPRLAEVVTPAERLTNGERDELRAYVRARIGGKAVAVPATVALERLVMIGAETIGCVVLLVSDAAPPRQAAELLGLAAVATLTELAIFDAREEVQGVRQGSLIELIRAEGEIIEQELLRRAYRLGSDLSLGAVALCAELCVDRPRYVVDLIHGQQPRALVEAVGSRVYALVPPPASARDLERAALENVRSLAAALETYATVGFSPYCANPLRLHRAIEEAELVLDVLMHEGTQPGTVDSSTYRLLVRTLAAEPEEIRRFYENTVAPLVHYDAQYHTDLVATLDAYLGHNCNMNQTAAAVYAHRHTISYRLERVRELTGLDPSTSDHRERLGLGLKAHRILAPRLSDCR
ncbi:MAG: PucR family transcriptional regulator [Solirubrobacteraceae bacterium]